jgi:hypothetical protein
MSARSGLWERYAWLLDDQLAALDGSEPDLDRFHALADLRARTARDIEATSALAGPSGASTDLRTRDLMECCRDRDQRVLERLSRLRAATAAALGAVEERRPGRAGYLAVAGPAARGGRLDVRR